MRDGASLRQRLEGTALPLRWVGWWVAMQNDDGASDTESDADYSTEPSDYDVAEWTTAAEDDSGASSSGDVEENVSS